MLANGLTLGSSRVASERLPGRSNEALALLPLHAELRPRFHFTEPRRKDQAAQSSR